MYKFSVYKKFFLPWWSSLSALAGLLLSFITWDDLGITSKMHRVLILLGIVIISFLAAMITAVSQNKRKVYGDSNKGITLRYGDIIKLGFPRTNTHKRIIVIPVNRCFDLICDHGLISPRSIHGQWINHYIKTDSDLEQVNQTIDNFLLSDNRKFDSLTREDKRIGNLKRYPSGTVVELTSQSGITFYLLALAELDKDLKAHCSELDFFKALHGLLEYYDAHGQGEDLYCPIMGDHIVRPTRSTDDMINFILSSFRFNKEKLHGNVHIVIYKKMKSDISIVDY